MVPVPWPSGPTARQVSSGSRLTAGARSGLDQTVGVDEVIRANVADRFACIGCDPQQHGTRDDPDSSTVVQVRILDRRVAHEEEPGMAARWLDGSSAAWTRAAAASRADPPGPRSMATASASPHAGRRIDPAA